MDRVALTHGWLHAVVDATSARMQADGSELAFAGLPTERVAGWVHEGGDPSAAWGSLEVAPGRWMCGRVWGRRFGAPFSLHPELVKRGCMVESSGQGALKKLADGLHTGSLCFESGIDLRSRLPLDSRAAQRTIRKAGAGGS